MRRAADGAARGRIEDMTQHRNLPSDEAAGQHIAQLARDILTHIPLARAMALGVDAYDGDSLTLSAPLAPNSNDKGCAFGGSLVSLMTLAGWGLIKLAMDRHGRDCDIFVQDSDVRYAAPVWNDFVAVARLVNGESFAAMFETLAARGRARARVRCIVPLPDGSAAATLEARFVAIERR